MIQEDEIIIAIIGLGYVGLPLAVEFSKIYPVVGYDLNSKRVNELNNGNDKTGEVDLSTLESVKRLKITNDISKLKHANIFIVTVPTPVDKNKTPDLGPLKSASITIGKFLKQGNIVVYESTVYPGATEEICVPILEKISDLTYNEDFYCGYSPERINPGDKKNTLTNIRKITSGSNNQSAIFIKNLYQKIIKVDIFSAASIKVAEAAKVIENTQRDVNIALINELALIFNKLDIDTNEVLKAAETKWNFLPFKPGLVGGHCIGVDPYYLTHKAIEVGYQPEIILAGRRINDSMGKFIAEQTILKLIEIGIDPICSKIGILGLTFKEDCPDLRNTKVTSIIKHLKRYKCDIHITDESADSREAKELLDINLINLESLKEFDSIIIAVGHSRYRYITKEEWLRMLNKKAVLMDVKSIVDKNLFDNNIDYWSL